MDKVQYLHAVVLLVIDGDNKTYTFYYGDYFISCQEGIFLTSDKYLTGGWIVDAITIYAYHTGSETGSTFNHMNYQIWNRPPNDPSYSVIFGDTSTNRLVSTDKTNIYHVSETTFDTQRPSKPPFPFV